MSLNGHWQSKPEHVTANKRCSSIKYGGFEHRLSVDWNKMLNHTRRVSMDKEVISSLLGGFLTVNTSLNLKESNTRMQQQPTVPCALQCPLTIVCTSTNLSLQSSTVTLQQRKCLIMRKDVKGVRGKTERIKKTRLMKCSFASCLLFWLFHGSLGTTTTTTTTTKLNSESRHGRHCFIEWEIRTIKQQNDSC